jgi:hypothetical protein
MTQPPTPADPLDAGGVPAGDLQTVEHGLEAIAAILADMADAAPTPTNRHASVRLIDVALARIYVASARRAVARAAGRPEPM